MTLITNNNGKKYWTSSLAPKGSNGSRAAHFYFDTKDGIIPYRAQRDEFHSVRPMRYF